MEGACVLQYDHQEDHSYRQSVTWTSATFGMRYITKSSEFYSHKAAASVEQYFLSHESIITTRLWCSLGAQLITLGQNGSNLGRIKTFDFCHCQHHICWQNVPFHPVVVVGSGYDFLFNSLLEHCDYVSKGFLLLYYGQFDQKGSNIKYLSPPLQNPCRQSHQREVPRWEIFMEQELRFGLDLGRFGNF